MAKKKAKKVSKKKVAKKNPLREKKYKDFDAMKKGHKVLSFEEIKALNEPALDPFLEEVETDSDEPSEGNIFACMDSGRLLVDILKKHNLHVITMSIVNGDDEDDSADSMNCTYCYSTGFHWCDREKYYLCHKKTPAFCEEKF